MATYSYIARAGNGERVTGRLAGASEQAVLAELQTRSLAPVRVCEVHEYAALRRRVNTRELATAYRQIGDLLRAGVPLLRALRLLGRSKSNPRLAEVMREVSDEVADGSGLADSMASREEVFPPVQIAMIRAGERGGFLEQVLDRLGSFLEQQADMRAKVLGNLFYPVALLSVGGGIIIYALVVLVPKFEKFYARIELPLPTRLILAASGILIDYWLILLVAIGLLVTLIWWLRRQPDVRRRMARWQLRVPMMGEIARDLAVGRFARILGTLLENGIPMLSAMQISRDATGHVLLCEAIERATEAVRAGETLAEPLGESGLFAEDALEIIGVGESANNLPRVLIALADTIEKRVDRVVTAALRLMEPLLLLFMAGMVLFIFIALVVPMLRMSSSL